MFPKMDDVLFNGWVVEHWMPENWEFVDNDRPFHQHGASQSTPILLHRIRSVRLRLLSNIKRHVPRLEVVACGFTHKFQYQLFTNEKRIATQKHLLEIPSHNSPIAWQIIIQIMCIVLIANHWNGESRCSTQQWSQVFNFNEQVDFIIITKTALHIIQITEPQTICVILDQ